MSKQSNASPLNFLVWTLQIAILGTAFVVIFDLFGAIKICNDNNYFAQKYWINISEEISYGTETSVLRGLIFSSFYIAVWIFYKAFCLITKHVLGFLGFKQDMKSALQLKDKITWLNSKTISLIFLATPLIMLIDSLIDFTNKSYKSIFLSLKMEVLLAILVATVFCSLVFRRYDFTNRNSGKGRKGVLTFCSIIVLAVALSPLAISKLPQYSHTKAEAPPKPYNVILIGIDSLRSDHTNLGQANSVERQLTPNIREFAKHGSVFQAAISQAPWTMPSFASILTGRYPQDHRAISLIGNLRKKELTIAEILRERGYYTKGITSNTYISKNHGFHQGFDSLNDDYVLGIDDITSEGISDAAIDFLENNKDDNFFLFMLYYDPHYNYMEHEEWDYADNYSSWLKKEPLSIRSIRARRLSMDPNDITYLTDLYDEEISYTDKHIARVLKFIEEKGMLENTIVVIVSDHGEEFMERGWVGHTISLYDELIKVPMVIALPDFEHNQNVQEVVEIRAIFPTILEHLGLQNPTEPSSSGLQASMHISAKQPVQNTDTKPAFSMVWLPNTSNPDKRVKIMSLRTEKWKLIVNFTIDKEYLFDIKNDPMEKHNLASEKPVILRDMRDQINTKLYQMEDEGFDTSIEMLDQDELERLKSLGYL